MENMMLFEVVKLGRSAMQVIKIKIYGMTFEIAVLYK